MLVLLACKDFSPLYKSSKTRKHLKPENLEALVLLSALEMPIKSVPNYQVEIKFLEDTQLFWFLDFVTVYSDINI